MSHRVLYREWRPLNFDDVVGQTQIVYPLRQSVIQDKIGHAYLFSGTRGTGKTSLAKIFARAVNCLHPENGSPCNHCEICQGILDGSLLDVMEMDAASNNSVDNIRSLIDEVAFMPARARYRVYIIDEVHMLSQAAFNALLKTLEEPPQHAIFILATTEPQRIPATILSRCQRFEFRRLSEDEISQRLRQIADAEHIAITEDALRRMARIGDGALRDAISLLDQCRSSTDGEITAAVVLEQAGLVADDFLIHFTDAFFSGNLKTCLSMLDEFQRAGKPIRLFAEDFSRFLRDLLVLRLAPGAVSILSGVDPGDQRIQELARGVDPSSLYDFISELGKFLSTLRWAGDPRSSLDILLIRLIPQRGASISEMAPSPEIRTSQGTAEALPARQLPEREERGAEQLTGAFEFPDPGSSEAAEATEKAATADIPQLAEAPMPPEAPLPETAPMPEAPGEPLSTPEAKTPTGQPSIPEAETPTEQSSTPKTEAPSEQSSTSKAEAPSDQPSTPETESPTETPSLPDAPDVSSDPRPPEETGTETPAPELPSESISEETWEAVKQCFREAGRIDLLMLLSPAEIRLSEHRLQVFFTESLRAHCHNLRRPQNLAALQRCLAAAGLGQMEICIHLEGEKKEENKGAAAKEEQVETGISIPSNEKEWARNLRKTSEILGLELSLPEDKGIADEKLPF